MKPQPYRQVLRFAAERGIVIETPDELRERAKTTTNKRKATE